MTPTEQWEAASSLPAVFAAGDALAAQVAELTAERVEFWRDQDNARSGTVRGLRAERDAYRAALERIADVNLTWKDPRLIARSVLAGEKPDEH